MTQPPLVTVILPTYNRANLLSRALTSVLTQSYRHMEVIVVDDASTDGTSEVVAGIADDRVVYHRLQERGGAAAARNAGIERATGKLIAFQDSDDEWFPDKLSRQVDSLQAGSAEAGVCVCSFDIVQFGRTDHVVWDAGELSGDEALARIVAGTGFATVSLLVRRQVLLDVGGFDTTLPRLQDYELTLRIAQKHSFVLMNEILLRAELARDSLSLSPDHYVTALELILQRHGALFSLHPRGHSHMVFRAGKLLALDGRAGEAISWFRRAWRIDRRNFRALAGIVLAALGMFTILRKTRYRYMGPD